MSTCVYRGRQKKKISKKVKAPFGRVVGVSTKAGGKSTNLDDARAREDLTLAASGRRKRAITLLLQAQYAKVLCMHRSMQQERKHILLLQRPR